MSYIGRVGIVGYHVNARRNVDASRSKHETGTGFGVVCCITIARR